MLLLGGGAQDAGPFVRALAEKLDAPTVMSVNGRGLLPPGHPLARRRGRLRLAGGQ